MSTGSSTLLINNPPVTLVCDRKGWCFDRIADRLIEAGLDATKVYLVENGALRPERDIVKDISSKPWAHFFWWHDLPEDLMRGRLALSRLSISVYDHVSWRRHPDRFSKVCSISDRIYYGNKILLNELVDFGVPQNKLHYMPDGVDTGLFCPRLAQNDGLLNYMWAGRQGAWRNIKRVKDIELCAAAAGISDRLHIQDADISKVEHASMPLMYAKNDVLVCFSSAEGTPNPVLEAAACGKFVISTPVGLVPEMEASSMPGLKVVHNKDQLTDAFAYCESNPHDIRERGGRNAEWVRNNGYGWENRAKNFFASFDVMGGGEEDLRSLVTVFVTTVGESGFEKCVEFLRNQNCMFQMHIIKNVYPMSAAFQRMLDLVSTPYFIQVDEDMMLASNTVSRLYQTITKTRENIAFAALPLFCSMRQMPVYGVRIEKSHIAKKFPYDPDAFSCEVERSGRMKKAGYGWSQPSIKKENLAGELGSDKLSKREFFSKAFRDSQKAILHPEHFGWVDALPAKHLHLWKSSGDARHIWAFSGALMGKAYPAVGGEKSPINDTAQAAYDAICNMVEKVPLEGSTIENTQTLAALGKSEKAFVEEPVHVGLSKKIVFACSRYLPFRQGSTVYVHNLAKKLHDSGFEVHVITSCRNANRWQKTSSAEGTTVWHSISAGKQLSDVVRSINPDFMFIQGDEYCNSAAQIAVSTNKKFSMVAHSLTGWGSIELCGVSDRMAFLLCPSFAMLDWSKWRGPSVVCWPLLSANSIADNAQRRENGKYITMINPAKDLKTFIELAKSFPDYEFLGVKGGYAGTDKKIPEKMPSNVHIIDHTDNIGADVYSRTNILLAPSTVPDSFCIVIQEAHANGIPIIANSGAGVLESSGGKGGVFVGANNDFSEWANSLQNLLNGDMRDELSKEALINHKRLTTGSLEQFDNLADNMRKLL